MTSSLSHPLIESMFLPWRQQHSFQSWPSTRTETDTLNMLYGKPCLLDEQCLKVESVKVSYCDRSEEFLISLDSQSKENVLPKFGSGFLSLLRQFSLLASSFLAAASLSNVSSGTAYI